MLRFVEKKHSEIVSTEKTMNDWMKCEQSAIEKQLIHN